LGSGNNAAPAAGKTTSGGGAPPRALSCDESRPSLVDGLRGRSVARRKKISITDGYRYLHARVLGDRVPAEVEGRRRVSVLKRIKISRCVPRMVHCDNGDEFSSQALDPWAYQNVV
jgi:hypothetical protein